MGQKGWAVARPPPLCLGNMKLGVLLLDLPLLLPGFRMPSRGLVGCQPLDPHRCCGPWRPLSRLGSERVGWVGRSLLFIPPHHHLVASSLLPAWDALPAPSPAPSPPFQETRCPTLPPSTWSLRFLGCPVPPAEVCALPALPGGDCQRCLARLGD